MNRLTVPRGSCALCVTVCSLLALSAARSAAQGAAGLEASPGPRPMAAPADASPIVQPVVPIQAVEPVPVKPAPASVPSVQRPSVPETPLPPESAPLDPAQAVPSAAPPPSAAGPIQESGETPLAEATGPRCLIGPLCFGPVLTAGVLDVFGIGAQARTDYWGVGIDYQFIWFTARGVPARLSLLTVEGRVYPFGNAFFLAVGLAWQSANFRGHITYNGGNGIPPIDTEIAGRINVPVLKLGLGFMGRNGFVMGIDLALGIQLGNNTVEFSSDLPRIQEVIDVENKIRKRADTFVRDLPFLAQLNLIRFGFLF